jgi:hypothetical protein
MRIYWSSFGRSRSLPTFLSQHVQPCAEQQSGRGCANERQPSRSSFSPSATPRNCRYPSPTARRRRRKGAQLCWGNHRNTWKLQLATAQVADVTRDKIVSLPRDRQFHEVIVLLSAFIDRAGRCQRQADMASWIRDRAIPNRCPAVDRFSRADGFRVAAAQAADGSRDLGSAASNSPLPRAGNQAAAN